MFRASFGPFPSSLLLFALLVAPAAAQQQQPAQPANPDEEGILRTTLPTVTVTATKEPADGRTRRKYPSA